MHGCFLGPALRATLATALALTACEPPPPRVMPEEPRIAANRYLALVVQPFEPGSGAFDELWGRGKSAAAAAATGASAGLQCLGEAGRSVAGSSAFIAGAVVLFCLALVPVGAVVGAVAGASASDSIEEIETATLALRTTLQAADPAQGIRRAVTDALQVRGIPVEPANGSGDAQHILELSVSSFDLLVIGRIDAEAAIVLNVQADLRYRDGTARSPPMSYGFISAPVEYLDLARDDAELLARMIEEAYVRTAGLIVDDLCATSE